LLVSGWTLSNFLFPAGQPPGFAGGLPEFDGFGTFFRVRVVTPAKAGVQKKANGSGFRLSPE
jgi:hypothetical protein